MPSRLLLCCLFLLPTVVVADAGEGQFMGYELGTRYPSSVYECRGYGRQAICSSRQRTQSSRPILIR